MLQDLAELGAQVTQQQGASLGNPPHLPRLQDLRNNTEWLAAHGETTQKPIFAGPGTPSAHAKGTLVGVERRRRGQTGGWVSRRAGDGYNPHLSPPLPPLPRLKAPAPLVPLYLPRPLGGAAARSTAPPTVLSGLRCLSRSPCRALSGTAACPVAPPSQSCPPGVALGAVARPLCGAALGFVDPPTFPSPFGTALGNRAAPLRGAAAAALRRA